MEKMAEVSLSSKGVWGQSRTQLDSLQTKHQYRPLGWQPSHFTCQPKHSIHKVLRALPALSLSSCASPLCERPKGKVKAQHGCSYGNLLGWPGPWLHPGSPSKFFHSLTITPWIRGRTHLPRAKMTHKAKLCHWLRLLNSSKMGRNVSRLQLEKDLLHYQPTERNMK